MVIFLIPTYACAQAGIGMEVQPGNYISSEKNKNENRKIDPFIVEVSKKFNMDKLELMDLADIGYGRSEIITLILIADKSGTEFKKIIKLRNERTSLKKLAERYSIPYSVVRGEAKNMKLEIEELIYSEEYQKILESQSTAQFTVEVSTAVK
ncbi:MAG: hypothetical protein ABII27_01455 [bacterium]